MLVSKVEEEKKEGFETVEVADSFIYKGKIEQIGDLQLEATALPSFNVGDIILFAKYSPDTHEANQGEQKLKIISVEDILAVL